MEKLNIPHSSGIAKGHIAILAANIIFGANISISQAVMPSHMDALALAFFRTIGAMILFWIASLFFKWEKVPLKDLGLLFLASLFGILMNQMLFIQGLEYISPIEAAIVVTFTPILTMLLSALFLKEPITFRKAVGVFLGLSGAVYMISSNISGGFNLTGNLLGIILCFVSGISYAIYLTAFKPLIQRYKPITLMKWMFLFGSIVSFPITFPYVQRIDFASWPTITYLQTGFIVVAATFLAYTLIPIAQKHLRPTTLSVYNYTQPITATLIALILGTDTFGWNKAIASLLVFSGVYIVTLSKSRAQIEELKKQKH